jgi:hypothetical protein
MISTGTFSVKAWATPGKAFSMPGPAWAANTPLRRPRRTRE